MLRSQICEEAFNPNPNFQNTCTTLRVIKYSNIPVKSNADDENVERKLNRILCIFGRLWKFNDFDLWSFLGQHGKLVHIALKFDTSQNKQCNYAFAEYEYEADAQKAAQYGQNTILHGVPIQIMKLQQNKSLVVYNIDKKWKLLDILQEACKYGRVLDLDVIQLPVGRTMFVEYENRSSAEQAKQNIPLSKLNEQMSEFEQKEEKQDKQPESQQNQIQQQQQQQQLQVNYSYLRFLNNQLRVSFQTSINQ
ncbi:MAG: hypothetical protein EZS28_006615 [Streblomastix strix]|uniref:RRM domain-containing protein n=1 Tax=Streblomastix strix TaxID=222440 RepID=A0A5J4WSH0_9EUKA|nr:MAG: hypothetical protein EZS28_006615 [Streblomastix strix]